eukprot:NODE_66_length_23959_cov_0.323009.p16 type:complete len:104 gc:universal NODE_66_length_23959_cov_0.323009:4821-4510(-)
MIFLVRAQPSSMGARSWTKSPTSILNSSSSFCLYADLALYSFPNSKNELPFSILGPKLTTFFSFTHSTLLPRSISTSAPFISTNTESISFCKKVSPICKTIRP